MAIANEYLYKVLIYYFTSTYNLFNLQFFGSLLLSWTSF